MDADNKGYEIAIEIVTSRTLVAHEQEIGNFIRIHLSRLQYLKISGDFPFHLDLSLTNSTMVVKQADASTSAHTPCVSNDMGCTLEEIDSWSESDESGQEADDTDDSLPHSPPLVPRRLDDSDDDSGYDSECGIDFTQAY